jgi:DNA polymerase-3 subunit beta
MKIICLQEKFKKAISIVERITGKNISLPILSNILIETDKGRLKISATDLEIGLNVWISAKVEKAGKVTIPVSILSNFISSLPQDKIYLETDKNNLLIKCGSFNATIKGLNVDDFPIIPKLNDQPFLTLKAKDIHKALSQVHPAASFSDTRPEIAGVFFRFNPDGTLKLAATDSFRLAEKTLRNAVQITQGLSLIIPLKTIIELTRILNEKDIDVRLIIKENQILFDLGDIHVVSRLIEGHFPDYERIIPQEFKTEVVIEKNKLIEAIRIASFFVAKANDVSFDFNTKDGLKINSASQELGSHNSTLKAEVKGSDVKLVFNYKYIIDGLNSIDKNKVVFQLNGKEKPLLMKGANDVSYVYIVMPVRDTD